MKKAVARYEQIAATKINFDKSEGLGLGAWRGGVRLPCFFRWSNRPVCILGVWFGPGIQLERNWSEVQAKVDLQVCTCLRRRLSLKGRAEACSVYVLILYRLSLLTLPEAHRLGLQRSLSKLLWEGRRPMVSKQVCCQRLCNGGVDMPDLENHWFAEIIAYLGQSLSKDSVWRRKACETST